MLGSIGYPGTDVNFGIVQHNCWDSIWEAEMREIQIGFFKKEARRVQHHYFQIVYRLQPFPKRQILDSSKLKGFADVNFELSENCRKFSK